MVLEPLGIVADCLGAAAGLDILVLYDAFP